MYVFFFGNPPVLRRPLFPDWIKAKTSGISKGKFYIKNYLLVV